MKASVQFRARTASNKYIMWLKCFYIIHDKHLMLITVSRALKLPGIALYIKKKIWYDCQ